MVMSKFSKILGEMEFYQDNFWTHVYMLFL